MDGDGLGWLVGPSVGSKDGPLDGAPVRPLVKSSDDPKDGNMDGCSVGL